MGDHDNDEHPAKFSQRVLTEIESLLAPYVPSGRTGRLLDPFAGVGGIHALNGGDWRTYGVEEIERWAAKHPNTIHGDSTNLCPGLFEPESFDVVCTSPTWGNGLNQRSPHPNAGKGKRYTYPDAAGQVMSPTNTGGARFGKTDRGEYRRLHLAIWPQVVRVLKPDGVLVLNSRDSSDGVGGVRAVTGWHISVLLQRGMTLGAMSAVKARGMSWGARRRPIGDSELLIVMHKTGVEFRR